VQDITVDLDKRRGVLDINVKQDDFGSRIEPFKTPGPLYTENEIAKALANGTEDNLFESLLLRGLIDE